MPTGTRPPTTRRTTWIRTSRSHGKQPSPVRTASRVAIRLRARDRTSRTSTTTSRRPRLLGGESQREAPAKAGASLASRPLCGRALPVDVEALGRERRLFAVRARGVERRGAVGGAPAPAVVLEGEVLRSRVGREEA